MSVVITIPKGRAMWATCRSNAAYYQRVDLARPGKNLIQFAGQGEGSVLRTATGAERVAIAAREQDLQLTVSMTHVKTFGTAGLNEPGVASAIQVRHSSNGVIQVVSEDATDYDFNDSVLTLTPVSWGELFRDRFRSLTAGFSYAVSYDGTLLEEGAFGDAISKSGAHPTATPMSATSTQTLASVTKSIVAVTILSMIDSGKYPALSLGASVFDLLASNSGVSGVTSALLTDPRVKEITVLQLLTHTAPLDEIAMLSHDTTQPSIMWTWIRNYLAQGLNPQRMGLDDKGQATKIGEVYQYSNSGYLALRGLIALLSGKRWEQAAMEVLGKAGLSATQTHLSNPSQSFPVRYYFYDSGSSTVTPADGGTLPNESNFGSSASDMAKFLGALRPGGALAAYVDRMTQRRQVPYYLQNGTRQQGAFETYIGFDGNFPGYAYRAKNGHYVAYAGTNQIGAIAQILRLDAVPLDFVVLTNTDCSAVAWPLSFMISTFDQIYWS